MPGQNRFTPNSLPGLFMWLDASRTGTMTREAGMAAQFTSANSEQLSISDNAALSMGDIVMDAWGSFYFDTTPSSGTVFGLLGKWQASDTEYLLYLDNTGGTIRFKWIVRDTANTTDAVVTATTFGAPSTSTWYFIHVYHNPTSNEIGISVNDGTHDTASTSGGIRNGTATFLLSGQAASSFMNGRMQCVGIRKGSTNLTSAQITALYNSGVPVAYADMDPVVRNDLVAFWELNEPSGTRVDQAGANNLTDVNTVTTSAGTCLNAVGTWTDLSGNGRHGVQATQAKKPVFRRNGINGKPVVMFDGIDDYMACSTTVGPTKPFHIFFVGKLTAATAAFKNVIGMSQDTAVDNWFFGWENTLTNTAFEILNTTGFLTDVATFTNPHIMMTKVQTNTETSEYRNNGIVKTGTLGTVVSNAIYLATRTISGGFQLYTDYQFGEVIIFNRMLTPAESRRVEIYLSRKWGINTI